MLRNLVGIPLREKLWHHFQVCLSLSCARQVLFLRKSTKFHDIQTECQIKRIIIQFLLYFFKSLPHYLRRNLLAPWSLSPWSLATQVLASWLLALWSFSPQRSLPDRSLLPITHSLIACLIPPTWYLVFWCSTCSLISWSIPPTLFWSNLLPDCLLPSAHPVPGILPPRTSPHPGPSLHNFFKQHLSWILCGTYT